MHKRVLIIACGALAREITELKRSYGWNHLRIKCIDARLHNRPDEIPRRVRALIRDNRASFEHIFVAYADCGTGGMLDRVLREEGVERLPGAHCYEFCAGPGRFAGLADAEPGTFYLTDFLAQHFDRFVIRPLKLDTHPELRDTYFGNYRRLVYLSQSAGDELLERARDAAVRLNLEFEHIHCGFGDLESGLSDFIAGSTND